MPPERRTCELGERAFIFSRSPDLPMPTSRDSIVPYRDDGEVGGSSILTGTGVEAFIPLAAERILSCPQYRHAQSVFPLRRAGIPLARDGGNRRGWAGDDLSYHQAFVVQGILLVSETYPSEKH